MTLPARESAPSTPPAPHADEFYIGYAPPMPPHLARFVKRAVFTIAAGVPLAASLIAIGHVRLEGGTFAFGDARSISGVIASRPYPAIRVDDDGREGRWHLLVAPGKHGADALVAPFDGQRVTLDGTRIERGAFTMFEVAPGSIVRDGTSDGRSSDDSPASARANAGAGASESGRVSLRGEIVDSKCFLGVMVPGEGRTHKDCASLCLRGGIPPALVVRDRDGRSALLLLISESGESLAGHAAALKLAGEPVEVTGVLVNDATPSATTGRGWPMLRTDPSTWRLLARPAR